MVKAAEKFWLSALALAALACACGPGEAVAPGSQALTPSNSDLALPQNYDLRFKGITLGAAGAKIRPDSLSNFLMGGSKSFSVGIGGPLTVAGSRACGPGFNGLPNCSWFQSHSDGILGLKTTYQNGFLNELQNDFVSIGQGAPGRIVITGLDLQSDANAYAVSYYTSSQPQTYTNSLLAARGLDELSAQVSYESARGGVVTALGVEESGLIRFVSCFRDGDFRTRRETRVARANFAAESISRAAKRLARQGYVITALGGNERQGLYLVGTREAGATAQRTISVLQGDTDLHNTPGSGIAPAIEVGTVIAPGARGGSPEWIWIYEN